MTREQFNELFQDQYRSKCKFMLDLNFNVKQRDRLLNLVNSIPEEIIDYIKWMIVTPNNFQPTIDTNFMKIVVEDDIVTFYFYPTDRHQTYLFIRDDQSKHRIYHISIPLKEFNKYLEVLTKTYYLSIMEKL